MTPHRKHHRFLIVGIGPTSQNALDELLIQGVKPADITVVYPKNKGLDHSSRKNSSLFEKGGVNVIDSFNHSFSLADFWGAACYPPTISNIKQIDFDFELLNSAYAKTSTFMHIDSHIGQKTESFPNSLTRKTLAQKWTNRLGSPFRHSLLAITGDNAKSKFACRKTSRCFSGCPNNAIWTPSFSFQQLILKYPEINVIRGLVVRLYSKKSQVILDSGQTLTYENLYLGLGPENTLRLLKKSTDTICTSLSIECSPVMMMPFLTKSASSYDDFWRSFVLSDLFLELLDGENLRGYAQIYLPTSEIFDRICNHPSKFWSTLARVSGKLFGFFLARRIGIVMTFLPGDRSKKESLRQEFRWCYKHIVKYFLFVGALVLPKPNVKLFGGESKHTGSLYCKNRAGEAGINSRIWKKLSSDRVYIIDASALPQIPPGPHTALAATLARVIVGESLREN